jgi:hypothetical protein
MRKLLNIAIPILVILGLFLVPGCAVSRNSASPPSAPVPSIAPMPAPAPMPPNAMKNADFAESGAGIASPAGVDRKIIRNGNITIEVEIIAKAIDDVTALATELGGYVVSSNKYEQEGKTSGRVSIRVPANRFDEAFTRLRKLGLNVPNESTNSQDVTEEYADLDAQLRNLQATETRLLALMDKAQKVEEILAVQRELSNIRGQIERIKGRMQYLQRTSDMAIIEVTLQAKKSIAESGWKPMDTLGSALRGLVSFGMVLVDIIIWLVIFIPLWVIIGIIVWLVRRKKRQAKARLNG